MSDTEQASAAAAADDEVKDVEEQEEEKEVEEAEKEEEEEEDEDEKEKKKKEKKKKDDDDDDADEEEDDEEEDGDEDKEEKKEKKEKKKKKKDEDEDDEDEEEEEDDEEGEEGEEKKKKKKKQKKEKKEGDEEEEDEDEEEEDDDEEEEGEEKAKKKRRRRKKKDDDDDDAPVRRKPPARAPPPTPPKTYYDAIPKEVWSQKITSSRVWEVDEEEEYSADVESVPSVDLTGTPAAHYAVADTLGQGYFATVVKATKASDPPVALKVVSKELVLGAEGDAKVLEMLDHANIVKCVESLCDDEKIYVALELCEGDWLQVVSEEKGAYTEADVHRFGKQLLSALAHMHEKNIVHGDLAPENLLLAKKSGSSDLKVAGFTNARVVESEAVHEQLIGNPGFQAPEVLMNQGFGKASDVWAAGCLLFFFVAGKAPFDDKNTMRMNMKIRQAKFEFADEEWTGVSASLQELIKKMLLPKPADRISAKDALAHAWSTGAAGSAPLPKFRENASTFGTQ